MNPTRLSRLSESLSSLMTKSIDDKEHLKAFLDEKYREVNVREFILDDPISIPNSYAMPGDIELTAFWTAILSWGQRKTIINKCRELFALMGESPMEFILNHSEKDRQRFESFKHRTFQYPDTLYFLEFLQWYYRKHASLEEHFAAYDNMAEALTEFRNLFFSLPHALARTGKHIASPAKNSSCKRLNMFLRWMVRKDNSGVDFGLWHQISPSLLMIPLDVHVERVARRLGLLTRKQRDWKAVEELTTSLRAFDPNDPVKYDFALFGLGVLGEL